ncbi:MAG TPA: translation elongation factor Ts [Rectinemataceae bacterium]|nr:translation elongation factor Ts [Rectinemataceae bacterium]
MTAITTNDIRALRAKTGAGLMDCKRALEEAKGEEVGAELILKEKGLAEVEKRAERPAREGRVFLHREGSRAALVALVCETDFVARNAEFLIAGSRIAARACELGLQAPDRETEGEVSGLASLLKENIGIKGMVFVEARPGESLDLYLHGEGSIGVALRARLEGGTGTARGEAEAFLHDLALHIAAFGPLFVDQSHIPESYKEDLEESFRKDMAEDERLRGKNAKMLENILAGKMRKGLASISLIDQAFVKDESLTVATAIARLREAGGVLLSLVDFSRLKIGE